MRLLPPLPWRGNVDAGNVQSLVLRGTSHPFGAVEFFRFPDARRGRQFLHRLEPSVSFGKPAAHNERPWLTVAVSTAGFQALEVPLETFAGLPTALREDMVARADLLGDVGRSDPRYWEGDQPGKAETHLLCWLMTRTSAELAGYRTQLQTLAAECAAIPVGTGQSVERLPDRREHFGFADGLSQPRYSGIPAPRSTYGVPGRLSAERPIAPGELLLGYPDEDGQLPVAPPPTELAAGATFLVYRKLRQDVQEFRRRLAQWAAELQCDEEAVAAKLVGRWPDGTPLVMRPRRPDPILAADPSLRNDFGYENDPYGLLCPLGAHVRRGNPRDGLTFGTRRVNRHRMVRRGIPYGPPLPVGQTTPDPQGGDRGLIFAAFVADIVRQFEFVQSQWINDGNAFAIGYDRDPLIGSGDDKLHKVPGDPPRFITDVPEFVTTRAGGYFFVPGRSGLRWLASGGR